jgi:hypothetical protein
LKQTEQIILELWFGGNNKRVFDSTFYALN